MKLRTLAAALLVALVAAGCAGTNGSPVTAANVDPSTLNEGGRLLNTWKGLFDLETQLTQKCLLQAQPTERSAQFETCYATPLAQKAAEVNFPLKAELNLYLNGSRNLASKSATAAMPQDDYRTAQVKLLDVFIVSVNRHLATTTDYFSGMRHMFLGDPMVHKLKQNDVNELVSNSNINQFLGVFQTSAINEVRSKIAARGGNPAVLGNALDLTTTDKKLLSTVYFSHVMAFFTYDDLQRLNAFYKQGGMMRAKKDQAMIYAATASGQDVARRKIMRAASRSLMEMSQSENTVTDTKGKEGK